MNEHVNTASIGDNKSECGNCFSCGIEKPFVSLSNRYAAGGLICADCMNKFTFGPWGPKRRSGYSQTLCADCKAPTPLNDMFPTGPDNIFKCWSCAQIPVLADITD